MFNGAYLIVLAITVIVAVVLMVVIRKPSQTSTNGNSTTLGLAKLSLFFIFVIVTLDTINDVIPPDRFGGQAMSAVKSQPASVKKAGKKKRVRRSRRAAPSKKREVNKDKYWLLGFVFLICMGSYIARHPKIAEFWERLAAAWKGNPIPNQSDTMEDFMITHLLQHEGSLYHEEWFLRAMVAKRGGNPFEGLPDIPPPEEPLIMDPEEGLEGYDDGESN